MSDSEQQPPPIPQKVSAYDGYEHYRDSFRPARTQGSLASYVGLAVGLAVWYASAHLFYIDMATGPMSGLVAIFAGALGFAVMLVYVVVLAILAKASPHGGRALLAAGVLFAVVGASVHSDKDRPAPVAATAPEHGRVVPEVWITSIFYEGMYGPPGEVPSSLLAITEHDNRVAVRNKAGAAVFVKLARVAPDARANGGWRGCALHLVGLDDAYEARIPNAATAELELSAECPNEMRNAALEYRVDTIDSPNEHAWWSSSAFAAPTGRDLENGRGNSPLPKTYKLETLFPR